MSNKKSQIQRVMDLYINLPREPQTAIPIDKFNLKIKSNYASSNTDDAMKKSIQRDLALLKKILFAGQVERIPGGRFPTKYRLSREACLENLNPSLALVLVMANKYLKSFLPQAIYESTEGFFIAAEAQLEKSTQLKEWSSRIQFVKSGYSHQNKSLNIQEPIYQAILEKKWMCATYRKESREDIKTYTLVPHGIINHENKNYLMATKIDENKRTLLRTFNMNNFEKVSFREEQLTIEIENEAEKMLELVQEREFENAIYNREPQKIHFVFHRYLLNSLEENPLSDDQDIQSLVWEEGMDEYYNHELRLENTVITNSLVEWFSKYKHWLDVKEPSNLYDVIEEYYIG